jgi:hypothetical protein
MLSRMSAEIMFLDPANVNPATAELISRDFEVLVLENSIDEHGPAVFILAGAITELDDSAFFHWVQTIVEPLGGDVLEAGHTEDDLATEARRKSKLRGEIFSAMARTRPSRQALS